MEVLSSDWRKEIGTPWARPRASSTDTLKIMASGVGLKWYPPSRGLSERSGSQQGATHAYARITVLIRLAVADGAHTYVLTATY